MSAGQTVSVSFRVGLIGWTSWKFASWVMQSGIKYAERWKDVQADFVEHPSTAIDEADSLVQEVMAERGYPVSDFEQRTADLSVQHSDVIDHYREGHAISQAHRHSPRSTEELRKAMIHYRALFSELLGEIGSRP